MFAPVVFAALLNRSPLGDAQMPLRSTVTLGGACANDCKRGELVLGAGEIIERRSDGWLVVLTARHVVDKLARPLVYIRSAGFPDTRFGDLWQSGRGRLGYVIARSNDADLALVAFKPRTWERYAVATLADDAASPAGGEIVGDPNGALWTVSQYRFVRDAIDTFVVDCDTCGPGDSGGGAFDETGRLAGILVRQRVDPHTLVDGEPAGTTQFQVVALAKVRSFVAASADDGFSAPPRARETLPPYAQAWSRFDRMREDAAL